MQTIKRLSPLPEARIQQWVLSFPYALRFLFATLPAIMGKVLSIVYQAIDPPDERLKECVSLFSFGVQVFQYLLFQALKLFRSTKWLVIFVSNVVDVFSASTKCDNFCI